MISLANLVVLGVGEQSSAFGMALYSDFRYAIHIKFVLGYLAMFVACLVLICTLTSYSSCLLRPDDLDMDIGSLCFWAYLSILPVHPKGGGPRGAKVVTSYAGMVPGYISYLPTSTLEVAQKHFTRPSISSHKIKLPDIHDYSLQIIIPRKRTWVI